MAIASRLLPWAAKECCFSKLFTMPMSPGNNSYIDFLPRFLDGPKVCNSNCRWSIFFLFFHVKQHHKIIRVKNEYLSKHRNSHLEVFLMFLRKGVQGNEKVSSKFTGEHPCWSAISKKLQSNFIEIALRRECSPVKLLHIFRIPFLKNTSWGLLLYLDWT